MAENKPTINNPSAAASKIAEQNKAAKEAADTLRAEEEAKTKESGNDNITIGATTGGRMMQNVAAPAGVQETQKATGYYSRHAGRVRIGQKTWSWPMEAPLVPKEGEDELREHLDSMVERGLATYVPDAKDVK